MIKKYLSRLLVGVTALVAVTAAQAGAIDDAVKIDWSGAIVDRVPVQQPAKVCMNDGALVKVTQTVPGDWADAEQSSGSEVSVVPTGPEGGEPATLALRTWKDSQWEAAPNGTLTDVGKHPVVTCQGGTIEASPRIWPWR